MNKLSIYAAVAGFVFLLGFGSGWHVKTTRTNAAIVKQVVKVAKIDAKNQVNVEKQDGSDKIKISELEDQLSVARRAAATHGVPKPAHCIRVSRPETDAGASRETSADRQPAEDDGAAYRALRDELLVAGATAEQLRLQVLSCQAQWPR